MAAPNTLLERLCHAQQANKSWAEGLLRVQEGQLTWTPTAGEGSIHIPWDSYTGAKRAKDKPMLMFMGTRPLVVRFASQEDAEAVSRAATSADAAAKAAAGAGAAPAAAPPGDGGGPPHTARSASPAAAAAAAAAAPSRPGSAGPSGSTKGSAPAAAGKATPAEQQQQQRSGMPSAAERRSLLTQYPLLMAQYETLVRGGTLTEEDFWCSPVYTRMMGRDAGGAGGGGGGGPPQRPGPSNQLPDITKMLRQRNEKQAMLLITPELQQQIFAEKPQVGAAFAQHVPRNMTAGEFWERYYRYSNALAKRREKQVRDIRRTQAPASVTAGEGEDIGSAAHNASAPDPAEDAMFARVGQEGEGSSAAARARKRRVNPAVDLDAHADDGWSEGYGLAHNAARSELDSVKGYKAVSRALARDYNTHALAVLQGSGIQLSIDGAAAGASVAAGGVAGSSTAAAKAAAAAGGGVAGADASEEEVQRLYRDMGTGLEDLQQPVQQQFEELHVTDPRTYFTNSSGGGSSAAAASGPKQQKLEAAHHHPEPLLPRASVLETLQRVDPGQLPNPPVQPSAAFSVVLDLVSRTTAAEGGSGSGLTPQQALPEDMMADLRKRSMVVNEVMRHFWALIPVNTDAKRAKFARLETYIERAHGDIVQLMQRPQSQETAAANKLLRPMEAQLKAAAAGVQNVKRARLKKAAETAQGKA